MALVKKKFGTVEALDRVKMKQWMQEPGVSEVAVFQDEHGNVFMQRVAMVNTAFIGVKKRFQKKPKK
jgi:hypothetical protein